MLRFAPLPYVTPSAPAPSMGQLAQPAIVKDESRDAMRYKTVALVATGLTGALAGWDAYDRLSKRGARARTGGYIAAGFGLLSAGLFAALLLEG